jgi:DNA-binding response OmpR family regulator
MSEQKLSILLVEDDPNLSMVLEDYLEMLGYDIKLCKDGEEGNQAFGQKSFDLCILDVMMPRKDGFSLAEDIRRVDENVPIIFLTAKSLKDDRIKGFKTGCDDYITKPFSTEELSLRIEAILRRCAMQQDAAVVSKNDTYQLGKYVFEPENMILRIGEEEMTLTRKENALLQLLCENQNQLLTREKALKMVWGSDDYFIGRSMDVFIAKLRKYLKSDPSITITNVHGTGFKLEVK